MASVYTDQNGNRTIQFTDEARKRRTIRLGRVPKRAADDVRRRVEGLLAARIIGAHLDAETAAWVRDLTPALARKLAAVGLVGSRPGATTLDAFVAAYIAGRTDVKPSTRLCMEQARQRLMAFFKPATPLRDVTPGDADRWIITLRGHYADATTSRTIKRACQFFTAARRARLIAENPFEGIKPGSMKNPDRLFYVKAEAAAKLVEAAPDADWRAIIALCRYGGLRCPSEVVALTWADVDWGRGRFLVRASKTEHHEHRGTRWVPLFPELRPHLEALWDRAEPGAVHVITRYRLSTQNMRTTLLKIIHRAGLLPWPRLIQNLRATRETELADRFPLFVVTAWMGNTEAVAARHYLSVRDEHFAAALHPALQQVPATDCNDVQANGPGDEKTRRVQGRAVPRTPSPDELVAAVGLEPGPDSPGESGHPNSGAARGAATSAAPPPTVDQLLDLAAGLAPDERARLRARLSRDC